MPENLEHTKNVYFSAQKNLQNSNYVLASFKSLYLVM